MSAKEALEHAQEVLYREAESDMDAGHWSQGKAKEYGADVVDMVRRSTTIRFADSHYSQEKARAGLWMMAKLWFTTVVGYETDADESLEVRKIYDDLQAAIDRAFVAVSEQL